MLDEILGIVKSTLRFQPFFLLFADASISRHYFLSEMGLDIGLIGHFAFRFEVILTGILLVFALPYLVLNMLGGSGGWRRCNRSCRGQVSATGTVVAAMIGVIFFSLNFIRMR
jgi:hypothetical protein